MRKVILKMHTSIDGYIRANDGKVMDWFFNTYDDQLKEWEVSLLRQTGTHIMGRNLYEEMAAYWPGSNEVYAPPMNEIPKVVFSRSMKNAEWRGTSIARGDLTKEVTDLKRGPGKYILVHGGASFVQSLSKHRLIDEYNLIIHPVYLSGGLSLFSEFTNLKLRESKSFPSGVVILTYESV